MNLSRNWLADFVDVSDISNKEYCDRMTDTGSKVETFDILSEKIDTVSADVKGITTEIVNQLIEFQTVKRPYIGISSIAVDEETSKRYNLPFPELQVHQLIK